MYLYLHIILHSYSLGSQRGPPPLVPADHATGKGIPGPPNVTVSQAMNVGLILALQNIVIEFSHPSGGYPS